MIRIIDDNGGKLLAEFSPGKNVEQAVIDLLMSLYAERSEPGPQQPPPEA